MKSRRHHNNDARSQIAAHKTGKQVAAIAKRLHVPLKRRLGDCEICGHWSGDLIEGACAPCREKYELQ